MKIAQIRKYDIANGKGVRTTLFVSGCTHNCPGCFNKTYQDFKYGELWTPEVEQQVIDNVGDPNVKGLSLLGGEPFEKQNARTLVELIRKIKAQYPEKNIWAWTGFTYEQLLEKDDIDQLTLFFLCDVVVDGRFVESKKNAMLRFRGSSNQRIIDTKKTLENDGEIVLWQDTDEFYQ